MLEQIEKTIYKVAIYIRLSKEDVDRGYNESSHWSVGYLNIKESKICAVI